MHQIYKGREPNTLTRYRSSLTRDQRLSASAYKDFPDKTRDQCDEDRAGNLRKILLENQGYICCYCMSRISCQNSKIEHFKDQSNNRPLQLTFSNLYVACMGNTGQSLDHQHCDTHKGSSNLSFPNFFFPIENSIQYKKSGEIESTNISLKSDIDNILKLNYTVLQDNRKNTLETFIIYMKSKYGRSNTWRKTDIQHEISRYSVKDSSGKYKEYCQLIIYHLTIKEAKL